MGQWGHWEGPVPSEKCIEVLKRAAARLDNGVASVLPAGAGKNRNTDPDYQSAWHRLPTLGSADGGLTVTRDVGNGAGSRNYVLPERAYYWHLFTLASNFVWVLCSCALLTSVITLH